MTTTTSSSNLTIINPIDKPSNVTFNSTEKAETQKAECDMFHGRWVYNAEQKPSYDAMTCPFIEKSLSCQKNGRPDFEYENWRWEARDCDIPLFDGKDMLKRLGNKRVIIVGDSINKNMWESLACLLYTSIPSSRAEIVQNSAYKALIAKVTIIMSTEQ
ncbi:hypothetical protein BVRB_9g225240 [Beta vulgaris subsp. vulgaris]|uniref:Uncharacterized protein n=1 Tax=Beta vulgaris subsp. vulgaris TaxID=3555 RepID=A0A0J8B5B2_BETVV|nr:hypothetical protein BVRB_9g225240 [Beta vulgaris subsp. vulgaris]